MTVATLVPSPTAPASSAALAAFPTAAVEACLRDELVDTVKGEAAIKGVTLPSAPKQIAQTPFQVDSLVVVSILIAVEPIVGFELPESVVRAGGYASVDSALEHLLPRIEKLWTKRNGGRP